MLRYLLEKLFFRNFWSSISGLYFLLKAVLKDWKKDNSDLSTFKGSYLCWKAVFKDSEEGWQWPEYLQGLIFVLGNCFQWFKRGITVPWVSSRAHISAGKLFSRVEKRENSDSKVVLMYLLERLFFRDFWSSGCWFAFSGRSLKSARAMICWLSFLGCNLKGPSRLLVWNLW